MVDIFCVKIREEHVAEKAALSASTCSEPFCQNEKLMLSHNWHERILKLNHLTYGIVKKKNENDN